MISIYLHIYNMIYVHTYIFIYNIFPCNAMLCDRQKPIDASDLSSCKNDGGSQMRQINIDRNQCKSSTLHCGKCHFHFLINWVLLKWSQQQEGWHPSSDETNQYRSITINASPTHWWRKINQSRLISELETRLQRSIGESHLPFILSYISLKSHFLSYLREHLPPKKMFSFGHCPNKRGMGGPCPN